MTIRVLTALDHRREAAVVAGLGGVPDVEVVRRCPDLPDLIAAAAAGLGDVALVSATLRGLDRDALGQLSGAGVPVVGIVEADEADEARLRQLGVGDIVLADAATLSLPEVLARVTTAALVSTDGGSALSLEDELAAVEAGLDPRLRPTPPAPLPPDLSDEPERHALVIAVWGPIGSPGRTSVAVNVSSELAALDHEVLLVDADTYGASIGQVLGLLDESPGMAAAGRAAELGALDLPTLARLAPRVDDGFRVLTGLPTPSRWSEVRSEAMTNIIAVARGLADYVVVDCGFSLEDDEELSYDTRAPRRNATTLATLAAADRLLVVGSADPVGLQRLVRALDALGGVVAPDPVVVVNRVRPGSIGSSPERRVTEALERFAGVTVRHFVPDDRATFDRCLLAGRVLREEARSSTARERLRRVALEFAQTDAEPAGARRRWRSRRSVTMDRWSTA